VGLEAQETLHACHINIASHCSPSITIINHITSLPFKKKRSNYLRPTNYSMKSNNNNNEEAAAPPNKPEGIQIQVTIRPAVLAWWTNMLGRIIQANRIRKAGIGEEQTETQTKTQRSVRDAHGADADESAGTNVNAHISTGGTNCCTGTNNCKSSIEDDGLEQDDWKKVTTAINDGMERVDWKEVTNSISDGLEQVDWKEVTKSINDGLEQVDWKEVTRAINDEMEQVDWKEVGQTLKDWSEQVDWSTVGQSISAAFADPAKKDNVDLKGHENTKGAEDVEDKKSSSLVDSPSPESPSAAADNKSDEESDTESDNESDTESEKEYFNEHEIV
jgi:hypothetical protein